MRSPALPIAEMSAMKINIVTPVHNGARFLPLTISSVLAQTRTDWNWIIVDDGSTDATQDIACRAAAADSRIRVIPQTNAGVSTARNRGYGAADPDAEFIIFLDADDLWEPNALAVLAQSLDTHPDVLAAHGLSVAIDADGLPVDPGFLEQHQRERWGIENDRLTLWPPDKPTTFAVEAVTERIITPGTVLIRRSALAELCRAEALSGPFDPRLSLWEDWDLWLRLTPLGGMQFVDEPVLRYRRHETNLSCSPALEEGARRVRRKLIAGLRGDPQRLRIARTGSRSHYRLRAAAHLSQARGCVSERRPLAALQQLRHAAHNYAHSL